MIANLGFINTKCITVGGIYPYEITNSLLIITKNTAFCDILQMPKPCFDGQCNSELQGRCGQDILSIYGFCTELRGYKNINTRSTALSRKTLCRLGQPARIWSIQSFLQILQSDVNGGDSTATGQTTSADLRQCILEILFLETKLRHLLRRYWFHVHSLLNPSSLEIVPALSTYRPVSPCPVRVVNAKAKQSSKPISTNCFRISWDYSDRRFFNCCW